MVGVIFKDSDHTLMRSYLRDCDIAVDSSQTASVHATQSGLHFHSDPSLSARPPSNKSNHSNTSPPERHHCLANIVNGGGGGRGRGNE